MSTSVAGWGGRSPAPVDLVTPDSIDALRTALAAGRRARGAIARGAGRSYGDAAQLARGLVLQTTSLRTFVLDPERGIVRAESGVTLGRLLAALAPAGWVLPVVPGTQHVTVGGAVAADIHGKNHGVAGTFGAHLAGVDLLAAGGEVRELAPDRDRELLLGTIGGMGLTGVILSASIRLRRLPSATMVVDTDRVDRLDDAFALLDGPGGEHRVAWLDLLGPVAVRGVVTRAAHAPAGAGAVSPGHRMTVDARVAIPRRWPGGLRPEVVRVHNAYRFRRTPARTRDRLTGYGAHMFPLDAVGGWPALYGRAGLVQYQFVVPRGQERAVEAVISALRRSAVPCYLAVLKDCGAAGDAPLSFPMAGWTLALDLPGGAPGLERLLAEFDELVAQAGGRVYLAKDGRVRAEALAGMYPRLAEWQAVRDRVDPDGRWASDLGIRTGLVARQP